jgi:hypothetical protein
MLLFFLIINTQDINHLKKEKKTPRRDENDNMKIKLPSTGDTGDADQPKGIAQYHSDSRR